MAQNKTGPLLLAGLAAFAYYKYSKMSEEQKRNIVGDLKEKGMKLYEQYAPAELKDFINKNQAKPADTFSDPQGYTG